MVGSATNSRMKTDLVLDALLMAVWRRRPKCTFHLDQGSEYTGYDWQPFLRCNGLKPSISQRGNCYDNAVKESFFSTLKMECIRGKIFPTRADARSEIFHYIEMIYNPKRRHSYLDCQSMMDFERANLRNSTLSTKAGLAQSH